MKRFKSFLLESIGGESGYSTCIKDVDADLFTSISKLGMNYLDNYMKLRDVIINCCFQF